MAKNYFATILIAFIAVGFFKVDETQAESRNAKFSSEPLRYFNPFDWRPWYNHFAKFMNFWFPYLYPTPQPSYWQKPTTTTTSTTTPKPTTPDENEEVEENTEPSDNIFGMDPVDDDVEYLPEPSEIEWSCRCACGVGYVIIRPKCIYQQGCGSFYCQTFEEKF